MPKYSIILPVRNGGNHIKECVNSILGQTCQDFELVILENNSTDGTNEWLQFLNNPKVRLISTENDFNIVENWGRIKTLSKNEFITLIGHDDILLPNYLETMESLIAGQPHATLYQTHFHFIDTHSKVFASCKKMDEKITVEEFLIGQFNRSIDSMGTGYMMRSKHYDEIGGIPQNYPNLIFADYQLWVELIGSGYLAVSPTFCFQYRVHKSASTSTNGQLYQDAFLKYLDFLNQYKSKISRTTNFEFVLRNFLMYNCESLSHRILKTNFSQRTITVKQFVDKCILMSDVIIPNMDFRPKKKFRIWIAILLDSNSFLRKAFQKIRRQF